MALTALLESVRSGIVTETRLLMPVIMCGLLAGRWISRFKIMPLLRLDEPRELPYWSGPRLMLQQS